MRMILHRKQTSAQTWLDQKQHSAVRGDFLKTAYKVFCEFIVAFCCFCLFVVFGKVRIVFGTEKA